MAVKMRETGEKFNAKRQRRKMNSPLGNKPTAMKEWH
jgi:hypothetical protein